MGRLAEFLAKVMAERPPAYKRKIKSLTPQVWDALRGVPKELIADAMLRGVINCHDIIGQDAPPRVFTTMGDELQVEARGIAVGLALRERLGKEKGTKEFERLRRALARKASMYKKLQVEYAALRTLKIKIEPWPRELQTRVGVFACDMLLQALPDVIAVDKHRLPRMSDEAARAINVDLYAHPVSEPSADPLPPWFGFDGIEGDTFVVGCRDEKAVRVAIAAGIPHVDAVNYLRSISFRINEHVLDVVRRGHLLKKVKDDAAATLLKQNLEMADRFLGRPFRIPLWIDFRGRLIAGPNLNFATPDHIRGLFKFDATAPIDARGLYWLKIACATAYDEYKEVSKRTFDIRLEWTESNLEHICAAGRNPLDHLTWLADAGDPIQCVALFHELANAIDAIEHGLGYHCSVPIGFDASCSGLQHFALLARDRSAAEKTNLVPTEAEDPLGYDAAATGASTAPSRVYESPSDIYDYVRRLVQKQLTTRTDDLADWWLGAAHTLPPPDGRLTRKIVKKLVMTYGYSAKEWRQKSGVRDELRRRREEIPEGAVALLVELVRKTIEKHIPAAPAVMKALQAKVRKDRPVRWVSPSGLPVANAYQESRTERINLYMLGRGEFQSKISVGWQPKQKVGKAKSSVAPNYIHSLDASHLARVANACGRKGIPLVTVHDSYATLPPLADQLRAILLQELREMYRGYKTLVPATGDLDLDEVTGAYAFS